MILTALGMVLLMPSFTILLAISFIEGWVVAEYGSYRAAPGLTLEAR
jgi:hypothetical protein